MTALILHRLAVDLASVAAIAALGIVWRLK